jgi:hypothetical protein
MSTLQTRTITAAVMEWISRPMTRPSILPMKARTCQATNRHMSTVTLPFLNPTIPTTCQTYIATNATKILQPGNCHFRYLCGRNTSNRGGN